MSSSSKEDSSEAAQASNAGAEFLALVKCGDEHAVTAELGKHGTKLFDMADKVRRVTVTQRECVNDDALRMNDIAKYSPSQ